MVKKKIMIVDDEEMIVELVKAVLSQEDYDVIGANNGQECLDLLNKIKPDLILMDMMMPVMTGKDTTKKIRANPKAKNIKIAFLTVVRFSEVGKDILKDLNISDYISKPFDNNDLIARVKKLLG